MKLPLRAAFGRGIVGVAAGVPQPQRRRCRWPLGAAQVHAMVLAVFASIFAPFGGFFASGFKRAFKMKDFGDTIPGALPRLRCPPG